MKTDSKSNKSKSKASQKKAEKKAAAAGLSLKNVDKKEPQKGKLPPALVKANAEKKKISDAKKASKAKIVADLRANNQLLVAVLKALGCFEFSEVGKNAVHTVWIKGTFKVFMDEIKTLEGDDKKLANAAFLVVKGLSDYNKANTHFSLRISLNGTGIGLNASAQ